MYKGIQCCSIIDADDDDDDAGDDDDDDVGDVLGLRKSFYAQTAAFPLSLSLITSGMQLRQLMMMMMMVMMKMMMKMMKMMYRLYRFVGGDDDEAKRYLLPDHMKRRAITNAKYPPAII